MNESIAIILLTYNRLELLKEVVAALKAQTLQPREFFVVNNSSTDGSGRWLEKQDGITVITQPNVGSSGGQYTGIKAAFDSGCQWIWTMDDDVVPDLDCLENLMKNMEYGTVHAPLRYNPDGTPFFNDTISFNLTNPFSSIWNDILSVKDLQNEYIDAVGITFEGPLFHRSLVEKIGLPEKKFFIYGDDTDYFIRAAKAGFKIRIVRDAMSMRKLPYADPNENFSWKHYYIIRNLIAIDVLNASKMVRIVRPIGYYIKWLTRCKKFSDVKTTTKAFIDGYFYKSEN